MLIHLLLRLVLSLHRRMNVNDAHIEALQNADGLIRSAVGAIAASVQTVNARTQSIQSQLAAALANPDDAARATALDGVTSDLGVLANQLGTLKETLDGIAQPPPRETGDTTTGAAGADTFGGVNDTLSGGIPADTVAGGAGSDTLTGGADTLTGSVDDAAAFEKHA